MEEELLVQDPETTPEPDYNFATVGEVYTDGVSLIFDGETEPSEKHYLVNTSIVFHAGDRVKIAKDAGTYVCEYVVGAPGATAPHELPAGGSADQVLSKTSAADYAVGWRSTHEIPSGGALGKVLKKKTAANYDVEWADETNSLPAGGSTDQVLAKSSNLDYATAWKTVHEIPSGGALGKVLKKKTAANYDVEWADETNSLPSGGSTGQVLAKSSNLDYAATWKTVHEIPSGGALGRFLRKRSAADYDVEWAETPDASRAAALINQYNTGATYDIQFRTTAIYGTYNLQVRIGSSGTWKTITLS